jgi:UDP-N-acetylglucosamine 1-carboxyvinyltransferase
MERFTIRRGGARASAVVPVPFGDAATMEKLVIEGGYPLSGTVVPAGNKNAALPILAASLLTEEELVIGNVPRIRDVDAMLALLEDLGVKVMWHDDQ